MNIDEYKAKIFEPKFIPQQTSGRQSKKAIKKAVEELSGKLNEAIGKFAVMAPRLSEPAYLADKPELIAQVRQEFEKAVRNILPYKEKCNEPHHISRGFYTVGTLYQAERARVLSLMRKEEEQKEAGVGEPRQFPDALYVHCACLKGEIESLESALEHNPQPDMIKTMKTELHQLKFNYLEAGTGVLIKEVEAAAALFNPATLVNTISQAEENALTHVHIGQLIDSSVLAVLNQINMLHELSNVMRESPESGSGPSRPADRDPASDDFMNLARLHSLGMAHYFFESAFADDSSPGGVKNTAEKQWYSRIFKICIDVADTLAYLLEHDQDGNSRTPSLSARPCDYHSLFAEHSAHGKATPQRIEPAPTVNTGTKTESESDEPPVVMEGAPVTAEPSQAEQKLDTLMNKNLFNMTDFYMKNMGDHLPETVLYATEQECANAEKLISQLQRVSQTDESAPDSIEKISAKISGLEEQIKRTRSADFRNDLLKSYKIPQASHWAELMKNGEVAGVWINPDALGTEGKRFYEVRITSKPRRADGKPQVAWLHVHVMKTLPKNRSAVRLWNFLRKDPENITAAHLKSDFFRTKGKEWEKEQETSGRFDALVKRSKVTPEFYQELDHIILGEPARPAASTSNK